MKYTLYIIYSIVLLNIAACITDRYPPVKEDIVPLDSIFSKEGETDSIPILPTFAPPTYNIITNPTRGTGVFNGWEEDMEHWMTAPFHTYSYWSGTANTDYTKVSLPHCLLHEDTIKIVDAQGNVKFFENNKQVYRIYPKDYLINKYAFFTFFCDKLTPVIYKTKDSITASLKLDGSSDLIHSYAYHSDSLYKATLASLPKDDIWEILDADKEEKNLLYSTISGRGHINPLFHLNHLLTRFDILIKAVETKESDLSFLNMIVDGITIDAPKDVILKVAKDSWDEKSYETELTNNTLLKFEKSSNDTIYQLDMLHKLIQSTNYNKGKGTDYDNVRLDWEKKMGAQDTAYFYIGHTNTDTLCRPLLVPPLPSYHLTMKGRALNIEADTLALNTDGKYYRDVVSETELILTDGEKFKAGNKYTITIYVYNDGTKISAVITGLNDEQWRDEHIFEIHD